MPKSQTRSIPWMYPRENKSLQWCHLLTGKCIIANWRIILSMLLWQICLLCWFKYQDWGRKLLSYLEESKICCIIDSTNGGLKQCHMPPTFCGSHKTWYHVSQHYIFFSPYPRFPSDYKRTSLCSTGIHQLLTESNLALGPSAWEC